MDTALKPETGEDKTGIVDVKLKTTSGKMLDVEIQVNPFPELGERYNVIQPAICVCILDVTVNTLPVREKCSKGGGHANRPGKRHTEYPQRAS